MNKQKPQRLRPESVAFVRERVLPLCDALSKHKKYVPKPRAQSIIDNYENPNYRGTSETMKILAEDVRVFSSRDFKSLIGNWYDLLVQLIGELDEDNSSKVLTRWEVKFVKSIQSEVSEFVASGRNRRHFRIRLGQYAILSEIVRTRLKRDPWPHDVFQKEE